MATLKDLSNITGVSVTTISRVLNHDETMIVSKETSKAIFDAAFTLGYVIPKKRKRKAEQKIIIGVADWHVVARGISNITLSTMHYFADIEYPSRTVEFVRLEQGEVKTVDGLLAIGDFWEEEIEILCRMSSRLVFVNSSQTNNRYDRIIVNLESAMEQVSIHLIHNKKHRRIAYIGAKFEGDGYIIGDRRFNQITKLMKENGLYNPELISQSSFSADDGYAVASRILDLAERPESILVGSDILAVGVLRALEERHLCHPNDIELVIYRDIHTTELPKRGYTVMQAYPDVLWQKAIQMLMEQIDGRTETLSIIIYPRLLLDGEY